MKSAEISAVGVLAYSTAANRGLNELSCVLQPFRDEKYDSNNDFSSTLSHKHKSNSHEGCENDVKRLNESHPSRKCDPHCSQCKIYVNIAPFFNKHILYLL